MPVRAQEHVVELSDRSSSSLYAHAPKSRLRLGVEAQRHECSQFRTGFAADSPLEGGVMCELVSGSPKFPASREKTGNLHLLALRGRQMMPNTGADPMSYEEIPFASEQGISCGLTGN